MRRPNKFDGTVEYENLAQSVGAEEPVAAHSGRLVAQRTIAGAPRHALQLLSMRREFGDAEDGPARRRLDEL